MKQRILQLKKQAMACAVAAMMLMNTACENRPETVIFQNPKEAINACNRMFYHLKTKDRATVKEIAAMTSEWLVLKDATITVLMSDSIAESSIETSNEFYNVSDQIKNEISRIAMAREWTMTEIVELKVEGAPKRKQIQKSKPYKTARSFFENMKEEETFQGLESTLEAYRMLFNDMAKISTEKELLIFLQREDRFYRSLMENLHEVSAKELQEITYQTSELFNDIYREHPEVVAKEEMKLLMTMRVNRRIIQNATACREDITKGVRLSNEQTDNYRWMLIQPFMTMDEVAMATLTEKQVEQLKSLADELPELLAYIEGTDLRNDKEKGRITAIMNEFFLKQHLNMVL